MARTSAQSRRADVMMIGLRSVSVGQGGVERHVERLTLELDRLGLHVEVLVRRPYDDGSAPPPGSNTVVTALWSPRHVALESPVHSFVGIFYAAIKRPRLVHIHAVGPSIVLPLGRLFGLRVVTTHHGEDYNREKWGKVARTVLRLGEWFQAYLSQGRISVSRSLAERLTARFQRPFIYVPNGTELVRGPIGSSTLAAHGLTPGKYVVTVSRLVPEKRHLDLIAAFGKLNRPDLKLAVVGKADHEGAYSRDVLRAAAEVPGVVIAGFQSGQKLAELFANAAAFALPSSHEGLPITLLEAMAYGRPVVVSDIEAHRDLALPAGSYHRMGDIDDLTAKLSALLTQYAGDTVPRVDWSAKLAEFDWTRVADKTLEVYRGAAKVPG